MDTSQGILFYVNNPDHPGTFVRLKKLQVEKFPYWPTSFN
jgi:hypothetical protein